MIFSLRQFFLKLMSSKLVDKKNSKFENNPLKLDMLFRLTSRTPVGFDYKTTSLFPSFLFLSKRNIYHLVNGLDPGARFSKVPITFRAWKAISCARWLLKFC